MKIVVTGLLGQYAFGGVTWDYLQYVLGFQALGHDVWYLEDTGAWAYDPVAMEPSATCEHNVAYLRKVMEAFGLGDRWIYRNGADGKYHGVESDAQAEKIIAEADVLANVSGACWLRDVTAKIPHKLFLDGDPMFTQIGLDTDKSTSDHIRAHDEHFSFGLSIGDADCLVPTGGIRWRPTVQPIALDYWQGTSCLSMGSLEDGRVEIEKHETHKSRTTYGSTEDNTSPTHTHLIKDPKGPSPVSTRSLAEGEACPAHTHLIKDPKGSWTTVMNWASYKPKEFEGETYGQKDIEFLKYIELPSLTSERFVLAMGQGVGQSRPTARLESLGWQIVEPNDVLPDYLTYRKFLADSRGEWSIAKNGYVKSRSGWFSCRSACYLALGRPVVVQDTGWSRHLPSGEGVLAFFTPEEAASAIARVSANYDHHCTAALQYARKHFDAPKVCADLLVR